MTTTIDGNAGARDAILGRVKAALGRREGDPQSRAQAYVAAHAHGPRPALPDDLVQTFVDRALRMESTVERIASREEVPGAVARYLDALELPARIAEQKSHAGVCWPEFADLDWAGAGLAIEARPTTGDDRIGITGTFCAIAETGTLVVLSGMEEAFALIRRERGRLPRAVNLISGPSRTGDIEQTIVLGAHGPFRVHILVVG